MSMPVSDSVIAIDGPSGSGKSTVSRAVARELGFRYLDTGATYRALTWWVLRLGIDPGDETAIVAAARALPLDIGTDPDRPQVAVDGTDVTQAVRGPDVTALVSQVSAYPGVRTEMVARQRAVIGAGRIVVEGRDIGTVVASGAAVKVFLTASVDARAKRRSDQDARTGFRRSLPGTRADLVRRDRFDSSRPVSPLAKPPDAVELDTTAMSADDVVAAVLALAAARLTDGAPAAP